MWQRPVYDRTSDDVANKTSKGYINVSDLNRIEGNIAYLANVFDLTLTTKQWSANSWMYYRDVARIGSNINALRRAYITKTDTPSTPSMPYVSHGNWNDLERILEDIKTLYDGNIAALFHSSEVYCGEV